MVLQYYVLFHNHTAGMELYNQLKQQGIRTTIAPTPRSLSKCCGISLLVKEENIEEVRRFITDNEMKILDIAAVENLHDVYRDKYC